MCCAFWSIRAANEPAEEAKSSWSARRKTISSTSGTEEDKERLCSTDDLLPKAWHRSFKETTLLESQWARACIAGLVGAFSDGVAMCWTRSFNNLVLSGSHLDSSWHLRRAEVREVNNRRDGLTLRAWC